MKNFKTLATVLSALCILGSSIPASAAVNFPESNVKEKIGITPRYICKVVVDSGSNLNLRSGPSASYRVVAKLPNGTTVTNSYMGNQGPYPDEGYFEYVTAHLKSGEVDGYVDYRYIECAP